MSGPAAPTAAPAGRRSGERILKWPPPAPPHAGDTLVLASGEVVMVMRSEGRHHHDVSVTPSPPCRACAGSLSYDPPSGAWICRDCGAVTAVTDPR